MPVLTKRMGKKEVWIEKKRLLLRKNTYNKNYMHMVWGMRYGV